MKGLQAADRLFADLFAGAFEPPEAMTVAEWMERNVVLIDGPLAGQNWSAKGAPYLVEIANCLGDEHPCNTVSIRKSQQSGASILALAWMLYVAAREPANTLYAVPGIDALKQLNGQKLEPLIKAWQKLAKKTVFAPQTSRSGEGSTTFEKKFAGGFVALGNANSIMDLSSKTCRKGVADELSKWELLQNGADPETLFFGRFTAHRRKKDYKILRISTPEMDTGDENGEKAGHCRIDKSFLASDRRFWNIACPKCGGLFVQTIAGLKIDYDHPHRSRYKCPHCPHEISEAERVIAVRKGLWVPMIEEPGREPGFHIDAFISLMMSYEAIAEDKIKSEKGSEKDRKDFSNLVLGLAHKFRGDAPDHKRLMERREEGLKRYYVPAGGLILVASADVQMDGIWVEIVAFGADRQSWVVDAQYLPGSTDSADGTAFLQLREAVLDRQFPDAFGGWRMVDGLAIDSGYRSHVVYSWVAGNQRLHTEARGGWTGHPVVFAVDGRAGWGLAPLGTPSKVEVDLNGVKLKRGVNLWPVGTWSLKSGFYTDVAKLGVRSGKMVDPPGYCHFPNWLDEAYFKQITSEHVEDVIVKGRVTGQKWAKTTENHLLDCRVYNTALFEKFRAVSPEQWAEIARRRGLPDELTAVDLFASQHRQLPSEPAEPVPGDAAKQEPVAPPPPPPPPRVAPARSYFDTLADLNAE